MTIDTGTLPVNEATYNALPQYYTDTAQDFSGFIKDYLSRMQGPGGYASGYTGSRVAGLDQFQTQANGMVPGVIGQQTPFVNQGADAMKTGQNWMTGAYDYTSQYPKTAFSGGQGMIGQQYTQLNGFDPYMTNGSGALGQASAAVNDSSIYDPTKMAEHMSPYASGVYDEIARRGNENLMEDILPKVNSTFTGAGQFGSTRNADFTNRAIRDTQREILGAQSTAMNQAHNQAAQDYLGWANQGVSAGGALNQIGGTYGNLGTSFLDKLKTGSDMGTGVANIGGQQASYGNILGNMAGSMSELGDQYGTYGMSTTNNNWDEIAKLYGMGGQNQNYNQKILDNAYTDWQNRWTQPAALGGALSSMIPQYAGAVRPDTVGYRAPAPSSQNDYSDILALLTSL